MSRELKFRAWYVTDSRMCAISFNPDLWDISALEEDDDWKVMQYTGLRDSNGREIYEGDILQPSAYTKSSIARSAVTFHKGYFCLGLAPPYVTAKRPLNLSLENSNKAENGFVVIGNIYENPELLTPPTT